MAPGAATTHQAAPADASASAGGYAKSGPSFGIGDRSASTDMLLEGQLGRANDSFQAPLGKGSKKGKAGFIKSFHRVFRASRRPLPTETGNGTYIQKRIETGLRHDVRTFDTSSKLTVRSR